MHLFRHSAIPPFRHSAIPLFRYSAIPLFLPAHLLGSENDIIVLECGRICVAGGQNIPVVLMSQA